MSKFISTKTDDLEKRVSALETEIRQIKILIRKISPASKHALTSPAVVRGAEESTECCVS